MSPQAVALERLARAQWRRFFSRAALMKAAELLGQERLRSVEWLDAGEARTSRLRARVRGTAPLPYEVEATLRDTGRGVKLATQCSCPVGAFCKHAAAMLLLAESQHGHGADEDDDPLHHWDAWLRSLEAPARRGAHAVLPESHCFALILRADREQLPRLHAQPVWLQPLKSGRLGAPKPIQWTVAGPAPAPAGGWDEALYDDLCALCSVQSPYYNSGPGVRIEFPHQERLIEKLIAAQPVYWEKPSASRLALGPRREVSMQWRDQDDGTQRLSAVVADTPEARPLRAHGLWYIDARRGQIGRLDGDAQLLAALPAAPPARPGQIDRLRDRLALYPRLDALTRRDAPAETAVETLEVAPRAVLCLRRLRYRHWRGLLRTAGCARLWFDYGAVRLPAEGTPRERRIVDGRLLEIVRDRAAENAARESLDSLRLLEESLASPGLDVAGELSPGDYFIERQHGELATPEHWLPLLPRLVAAGFALEFEPEFPVQLAAEPEHWSLDVTEDSGHWFDLSLGIVVGGERVELLPILRRLLSDPAFPLRKAPNEAENAVWLAPIDERRYAPLPLARLRSLIEPLIEWLEGDGHGDRLRLRRLQAGVLDDLQRRSGLLASGADGLRSLLARLRERPAAVDAPPGFGASLRPYQREGLAWLGFLADAGLGGVLADDMGLGKTVQVLAHLLAEKQRGRLGGPERPPALVICPTSLVGNWRAEAARFAPDLRVLVLHGPARGAHFKAITEQDLVITTYPLLPRDREPLLRRRFALLILDEAQQIKNARTLAAQVVRELSAERRLAMTGTPLENHLGELWAQFDAVEPGLLGEERRFARHYRTPIEKHGDAEVRERLNRRIAPLMLRRRKQDVLSDLPPKTEILRSVELEGRQRELYETLRLAQHLRVQEAVAQRGLSQSGIVVLDALLKLRQVCCDPRLVKLESARRGQKSAKLELLLEMLDKLVDEGHRVLVFSQFTEMLELIAQALRDRDLPHFVLTGQTQDRTALVQRFQGGEAPVFLVSLKAGGVGLNLTAADTVIHYDPWWNPAVEAQATDRAHRIGQAQPVFVYRLICAGTVEEKIQALQARKAELARAVLEGGISASLRFDEDDLQALFAPL